MNHEVITCGTIEITFQRFLLYVKHDIGDFQFTCLINFTNQLNAKNRLYV